MNAARVVCSAAALLAAVGSGCAAAPPLVSTGGPPPVQAPLAEPAAAASDASADSTAQAPPGARPVDFFAIGRGDRVADLGDGRGYSIARMAASDAGRIAPQTVRAEVESVGFQFVEAADFISQGAAAAAGAPPGSQYALKFQKPR